MKMQIKNEEDLANVLSMALVAFANKVGNGYVAPFKGFLEGKESINLNLKLNSAGQVVITEYSAPADFLVATPLPVVEVTPVTEPEEQTTVEEKPKTAKRKRN